MSRWLKTLKGQAARAASAIGLLSPLTDAYLFLRFRAQGVAESGAGRGGSGDAAGDGGPPLPPAWLRFSSSGTDGVEWFMGSGRRGAELVRRLAREARAEPADGASLDCAILDCGCGCGRVLRHLTDEDAGVIWGVDWNRRAIRWCSKNLPHARFVVGSLEPPLSVPEGVSFHLIYAFSVFSHMPVDLQRDWLAELSGRLHSGGLLAFSTHGDDFRHGLSDSERQRYDAGEIVVRQPGVAGTNVCAAYHPPGSLETLLPAGMEVLRHEPAGAVGNPPQDLWVLRKV